ncbi:MAG: ATPase domain-containing protein [Thermoplasmata archaeon]
MDNNNLNYIHTDGNFPPEFKDFFKYIGSLLLIRGKSGTGKTIFSIQLINDFSHPDDALYISTRTSEVRLMHQFPWMDETWLGKTLLFSKSIKTGEFIGLTTKFFESKKKEREQNEFQDIKQRTVKKSLVVVDSIEGLAENLHSNKIKVLNDLIKLIIDPGNANLVVISESYDDSLTHLSDGIVSLHKTLLEGRVLRFIHIEKLRGTNIQHPKYLFTLQNAKFKFVPHFPIWSIRQVIPKEKMKWSPIPTPPETISSGSENFDNLLNGGFAPGTYSLFILGQNVPNEVVHLIQFPFILDSLSKKRGLFIIPTPGISSEQIVKIIKRYIDFDLISKYGRFVLEERFPLKTKKECCFVQIPSKPNIDDDLETFHKANLELREVSKDSVARIVGLDYLDARYSNQVDQLFRAYINHVAITHSFGDIQLSFVRETSPSIKVLLPITDAIFKVDAIEGTAIIYGVKPRTSIYAIQPDFKKGIATFDLVPIV